MKKRLFIASSVEGLDVAYAIQDNLDRDLEVTVWSQGVFTLSKTTIEELIEQSEQFDGAVFVFSPDDTTIVRGREKQSVRDNVIFELGLFIGKLGRENCFIVKPRSLSNFDLPTDLFGLMTADYNDERTDGNLDAAVGSCAHKIRQAMTKTPESIQDILTSQPYRLFFRPDIKRSKRMVFKLNGLIVEGNNRNEHSWRIMNEKLELIQLDGKVHSRFIYNKEERIFQHTNDTDTLSIRNQFMVPDVSKDDV